MSEPDFDGVRKIVADAEALFESGDLTAKKLEELTAQASELAGDFGDLLEPLEMMRVQVDALTELGEL